MRNGLIGLLALILLAFIPLSVMAQDVAIDANATANTSAPLTSAPSEVASPPASPASIQGIWKVSLAGADITMAVNQSGDSLFGQCKFEGDTPWNGVVAGSVSGRAVNIAMAALQGKVLVSTDISGTVSDDSIKGSYIRSDSNGLAAKGDMNANRTSTDTAGYTPAKVEAAAVEAPSAQKTTQTNITQTTTEQAQQLGTGVGTIQPAVTSGSAKYNDVTNLAKSIDPMILPRHANL